MDAKERLTMDERENDGDVADTAHGPGEWILFLAP
jgi:hypothetical protein